MFKTFIFTEIFASLLFYALAAWLIRAVGLEGVVISYAVNYAIYWVVVWFMVRRNLRDMKRVAKV